MNRDEIRSVFLAHGFTVKKGQADLKPYVYEAAEALLARAQSVEPVQEPVANLLNGWKVNHARKHPECEGVAEIGYLNDEDCFSPVLTVDTGLYDRDEDALPLANAVLSVLTRPASQPVEPVHAPQPVAAYPAKSISLKQRADRKLVLTLEMDGVETSANYWVTRSDARGKCSTPGGCSLHGCHGECLYHPAPQPVEPVREPLQAAWRTIESAPKDGTSVLLCKAIDADGNPIDWGDDLETAQVFVQVAAWWDGDDAWVVYCSQIAEPHLHFEPTHWMPLPHAPVSANPAPQPVGPVQQPVAWRWKWKNSGWQLEDRRPVNVDTSDCTVEPLYTRPAPQPVELTDEEIEKCVPRCRLPGQVLDGLEFARAVIAVYQKKQEGK